MLVPDSVAKTLDHLISPVLEQMPLKKTTPAGATSAQVWVEVGDTRPADLSQLTFPGLHTNSPYLAQFTGAEAGKKAHYILGWVSRRWDKGPWSDTMSATMPG